MGASTKTTTGNSTQTSTPWSVAIPGLTQAVGDATNLYSSGVGSGIYSGPRVAQFNDDTLNGLQSMRDQTSADNSGAQGVSFAQGLLGSGGISSTTQQGLGMLADVPNADTSRLSSLADYAGSVSNPVNQTASGFMSGARDLTTEGDLRGLLSRALAPSAAETNLSGVASGQYLDPTTNPYLQAAVAAANQNVVNANKASFAASGRYGSGSFAGAQAKAVNDTDTTLYANQYNQERQNQLAANSQIDSARQAGTQLGTGIVNDISGVQSTNNQQRLAGAGLAQSQTAQQAGILGQVLGGDEFNSGLGVQKAQGFIGAGQTGQAQALSAAGMLPSLDASRYVPGQTLLGIGSALQGQDQSNINAAMQLYQQQQTQPWASLDNYASLVGGIGGMGGTTTGTSTQTQKSDPGIANTLLGGLTGIAGLGSNLGNAVPFLKFLGLGA
ncbi:hypothetical protein [Methylobacterium sp. GC_Met_2]|uniref:hypothetical protein n=1 Tax=Methylobacterium sp. GC_Met_2 TaxID=2937376 RepID=UPI00226B3E95|nr:hypothetical protein [Methylobacterium sp. GC_Met_2]